MSDLNELESDFVNEQKGEGALSIFLSSDGQVKGDYLGWDINLEDIEALYFDGIGVPRWESLAGDSIEEKTALYWERFNAVMDGLPMIARMRDTDAEIGYTADEMETLLGECDRVLLGTNSARARRAVEKISLAVAKASAAGTGLRLAPTQTSYF